MNQSERRQYLIRALLDENKEYRDMDIPASAAGQAQLLRGLMNIRAPHAANPAFIKIQDVYLKQRAEEKGIIASDDLQPASAEDPALCIWQGDITRLACDVIVNAANSGMTGCYIPNHNCIDNCIHTYAGIQLRLTCDEIMKKQGHEEPTGQAKITPAFDLPCRYVIHTVGPVIRGPLTHKDCGLLESCYRSCLELAAGHGLKSIAFCCISTGVFHFPNDKAAEIAIKTVKEFLKSDKTSIEKVIFNVFKDEDREIYERILSSN